MRWAIQDALAIVLLVSAPLQAGIVTIDLEVRVDPAVVEVAQTGSYTIVKLDANSYDIDRPGAPNLPWQLIYLSENPPPEAAITLTPLATDSVWLTAPLEPTQPQIETRSIDAAPPTVSPDPSIYGASSHYPADPVRREQSGYLFERDISAIGWCPFRYHPTSGLLEIIREAHITIRDESGIAPPGPVVTQPTEPVEFGADLPAEWWKQANPTQDGPSPTPPPPGWLSTIQTGLPLGVDYVIVTNQTLAPVFADLARWKAARGLTVGIAHIENITASYSGVDNAEQLHAYLSDAHAAGLQWAVLGGDETVVPIRYAFHGYTTPPPMTNLYNYQICDLYFAEFDADWDADGDGVWGEYFGDQSELTTEIGIGRIPVASQADAAAAVDKIIAYEQGRLDPTRLTHALHASADQMRDWSDGTGQHTLLADKMGPQITQDLTTMIESPTGDAPSPSSPFGPSFIDRLAEGWGWVDFCLHGRSDGFAVSAPGTNQSPRNFVWTFGAAGDGHGHLSDDAGTGMFGIWNSIACDQGGFDMDAPPFARTTPSVAQTALAVPDGGAVAFIGYSRWGWVGSSYRMTQKFYEYAFDPTLPNHIGDFVTLAKLAYPSYRDLTFGMNLYGDPEMPVWRDTPQPLIVARPALLTGGTHELTVDVTTPAGAPVANAVVMLQLADSTWSLGSTDASGHAQATLELPWAPEAIMTVTADGYTAGIDTIPFSIATDINDDLGGGTPTDFTLSQNVPNPFNASTAITFTVDRTSPITIDIYDVLGRRLRRLTESTYDVGTHHLGFEASDTEGRPLATGIYFYRLTTPNATATRKMLLLR